MKITIITYLYPGYTNQSRKEVTYAVHDFAKEWIKKGHEVNVIRLWNYYPTILNRLKSVALANRYSSKEAFVMDGVKVTRYPIFKKPGLPMTSKKKKEVGMEIYQNLFQDEKPDIIISHMINNSLEVTNTISGLLDIPQILVVHSTDLIKMNHFKLKEFERIEPKLAKVGFRSKVLLKKYKSRIKPTDTHNKYFIVNSGVEKEIINKSRENIYSKYETKKTILVVSQLIKRKNIDKVISVFSKLSSYNYMLKIIGTGKEKNRLVKLTKKLNLESKVVFMGQISKDNVIKEMRDAEIFILPSKNETLGLVYLEAMSQGCLTIGSKNEGIDGIIEDEQNGFLCNSENEQDIEKTLKKVINLTPIEKRKISDKAIKTMKCYTTEKVASHYLTVLEETVTSTKK